MVTDSHRPSTDLEIPTESLETVALPVERVDQADLRERVLDHFRRAGHTLAPEDAQARAKAFYNIRD